LASSSSSSLSLLIVWNVCSYCDPAYAFPNQREVIDFAVATARKAVEQNPNTVIVCGAYTIGKERIFMGEFS
jgi:hypothetical protein